MQVADLVEEYRAPVGQFEPSSTAQCGSRERAFLVAEKLALDQFRRDGGAVDLYEGATGQGAFLVNVSGDKLLSGPGLAGQQDPGVRTGNPGRLIDSLPERATVTDHSGAVADDLPEFRVLLFELRLAESVLHG